MRHIICYRNDEPNEIAFEYDYDDTPEVETPEMIDRCFHDYDEDTDEDSWRQ